VQPQDFARTGGSLYQASYNRVVPCAEKPPLLQILESCCRIELDIPPPSCPIEQQPDLLLGWLDDVRSRRLVDFVSSQRVSRDDLLIVAEGKETPRYDSIMLQGPVRQPIFAAFE
jgi:hypothetical protein